MALYGYYLGYRRQVEEQQGQSLNPSLLRCPFVMGILGTIALLALLPLIVVYWIVNLIAG